SFVVLYARAGVTNVRTTSVATDTTQGRTSQTVNSVRGLWTQTIASGTTARVGSVMRTPRSTKRGMKAAVRVTSSAGRMASPRNARRNQIRWVPTQPAITTHARSEIVCAE